MKKAMFKVFIPMIVSFGCATVPVRAPDLCSDNLGFYQELASKVKQRLFADRVDIEVLHCMKDDRGAAAIIKVRAITGSCYEEAKMLTNLSADREKIKADSVFLLSQEYVCLQDGEI